MKSINKLFLILLLFMSILISSCEDKTSGSMIVITETKSDLHEKDFLSGKNWRLIPESRIVAIDDTQPGKSVKLLTKDFFSACSPDISYDGKSMLFAGQLKANDPWQIWEMNLTNLKFRQVTASEVNCIDPAYLPGNRLVYGKMITNENDSGYALITAKLDGSEIDQITYNPHTYFDASVLKDGRILVISRQTYPEVTDSRLMVMRPDGTKYRLFYKHISGSQILCSGKEADDGKVYFVESVENSGKIISVNYNRPLHSRENVVSGMKGDFFNVNLLDKNKLLTVYRPSADFPYALYSYDLQKSSLSDPLYKNDTYNVVEAVLAQPYQRPKNLPSELKMSVNTGIMVCQDINFTNHEYDKDSALVKKAVKIEVLGVNKSLGTVKTEKDGSFYLKVLADVPFRIQTLDEQDKVVNGPGYWLYLRPNERLGCVGCHEDPEQTPFNRQPLAVKKEPVILQEQIKDIQKKESH